VIAEQKRRIAELEREVAKAKTTAPEEDLRAEVEKLRETNFDLEATLQTVEVEKQFAVAAGVAEAKAELKFKEAEAKAQPQRRVESSFAEEDDDWGVTAFGDDPEALSGAECGAARAAVADAATQRHLRARAVEAVADVPRFSLAEALLSRCSLRFDGTLASRLARKALRATGGTFATGGGRFVLALYRSCDGQFDDQTTRLLWGGDSTFFDDDDDDASSQVLRDLATEYLTNGCFDGLVWPCLARLAHRAALRPLAPAGSLRTLVDLASAVAVDDPDRARRLLAARPHVLVDLLNFANDSLHHHLTSSSAFCDDLDDDPHDDPDDDVFLDDARAVVHLLGHVAFFVSADAFLQDIYNAGDLAVHELRALCHRAKFAVDHSALTRDADQLLSVISVTADRQQQSSSPAADAPATGEKSSSLFSSSSSSRPTTS